ncbi:M48 family metallopeptidase [Emcibacter sp. SYSU 3D8]|uniref:M48 family metallopeptidase n=1 Tax=Emcibacter sp. SYSU 3D8 TaxID=3133969 RepID=UPI0031FEF443
MNGSWEATLYDGHSAAGRACSVTPADGALEIRFPDGAALAWTYTGLTLISDEGDGNRLVLAPAPAADERLTVSGPGVFRAMLAAVPSLRDQQPTRGYRMAALTAGAIVAVLALAWAGYPLIKDGLVAVFPAAWSDRIGEEMVADESMFEQPCHGTAGIAALDDLAARLSRDAGLPEPITVHVRSSGEVNAFAATGGHIAVLDGLIQQAATPDEVAGVLAHEIGHVKHRHPLKRLIDVAGIQLIVTGISGDVGAIGTMVLMLNYGRRDEAQADSTALELLDSAGIRPGGLAEFFDRMAQKQKDKINFTGFLRTHPPLADRSAMMHGHRPPTAVRPALTDRQWQDVRAVCAGVKASSARGERAP